MDSEFAFCAHETITYTGSGSLVGPCEVEVQDSLIQGEEGNSPLDFVEATEEPVPVNATTGAEEDNMEEEVEEEVAEKEEVDVDQNDFNIAFAEGQSSGRVTLFSGIAASAALVVSMVLL